MKILFDFFPIVLFFIAYYGWDIYTATAVAIIASIIQVSWFWFQNHRFEKMQLISLGLIVVLGGATLLLHDERFIKWKPTLVEWAFALVFLGSQWVGKKNLVERMFEEHIQVTSAHVWNRLNIAWVSFFILMGFLNLYVAFNYSTDVWVNFKLFGMLGLTFLFVMGQGLYLAKYAIVKEQ